MSTSVEFVTFREYVRQALKNASYEVDHSLGDIPCVVAEVPDLPGCFTQGENYEDARENLIDAIELWITAGLRDGAEIPVINGCALAASKMQLDLECQKEMEEIYLA
jgi:predicted RNase H-like HicB family nuclease